MWLHQHPLLGGWWFLELLSQCFHRPSHRSLSLWRSCLSGGLGWFDLYFDGWFHLLLLLTLLHFLPILHSRCFIVLHLCLFLIFCLSLLILLQPPSLLILLLLFLLLLHQSVLLLRGWLHSCLCFLYLKNRGLCRRLTSLGRLHFIFNNLFKGNAGLSLGRFRYCN